MSSSVMTIEPLYVVDTHALIWYLIDDRKLGEQAAQVFSAAEEGQTRIVISAIVLAEMYYANQKKRWFADFQTTIGQLKRKPYFRLVAVKPDHILDFDYDVSVPEMHDRIIAGLARRIGAPLITADGQITASNQARIIW